MIRTTAFALLASLAVAAGPAAAKDIAINIVGKSPEAVRAEITAAANAVCRQELRASVVGFVNLDRCVEVLSKQPIAQAEGVAARLAHTTTAMEVTRVSAPN